MSLHEDAMFAAKKRQGLLEAIEPAIAKYCADYGIPRSVVDVDVTLKVLRSSPEATRERSMIGQPLNYRGII